MTLFNSVTVSAPSKIILHGEHSVVYGTSAVAGSLNLRTRMTIYPNNPPSEINNYVEEEIVVDFPDIGVKDSWNLNKFRKDIFSYKKILLDNHHHHHQSLEGKSPQKLIISPNSVDQVFLNKIQKFLQIDSEEVGLKFASLTCFFYLYTVIMETPAAMTIKVESEIPIGAGLGSSAALSVCLAAGLLSVTDEMNTPRKNCCASNFEENSELISELALLSEKILHGTPSGIDNSISSYGGLIKFKNGVVTPIKTRTNLRVLLVNTGVDRSTKLMVESVRKNHQKYPSIIEPVLEAINGVSETFLSTLSLMDENGDSANHYRTLESLIDYNQKLLETLDVSHPHLDEIFRITKSFKLHGKLTGAGGGGFAYVLLPPYVQESVIKSTKEALKKRGYESWETSIGVSGVKIQKCNH